MKIIPNFISTHLNLHPHFHASLEGRAKATRDWSILIIVSILIIAVEIVWSIFFFSNNIKIRAPVHITVAGVKKIDTNAMQRVQDVFSKRASMQSAYESNATLIADPSK